MTVNLTSLSRIQVVDTFQAQVQVQPVMLTYDACQHYVFELELALELIVKSTVN